MTQAQFFESVHRGLGYLIARTEPFLNLDPELFAKKTEAHDWSLGQLFDHLVKSDVAIGRILREVSTKAPESHGDDVKHSFFGRLLISMMAKPNVPVPNAFLPSEGGRPSAEAYLAFIKGLREDLANLSTKNLARSKVPSPGARFISYNGYDALALTIAHGERHLAQAESVRRSLGK
ncbi:MAG: DinB family protein [Chthonomonas sp.]|nr:DinB family protein [Chthonomonas sp.]